MSSIDVIDTHTHLESFVRSGELDVTLARAREAGVRAMITIGTSLDDWELYRRLASEHRPFIHYSVGLHPCSVGEKWSEQVEQIERFWREEVGARPVALGECGLDRFHLPNDDSDQAERLFSWQRDAFNAQLGLAKTLGCPVVIHSRGAFAECVELVDASGVSWNKVVFHCFTEGQNEMRELVRRGGYGSFTGILTYKTADNVRAAAREQGIDRFMVETDAPYLTPMPHRGKPNEPAFVTHTAAFAAELFGVSATELAARSTATARSFFGLGG